MIHASYFFIKAWLYPALSLFVWSRSPRFKSEKVFTTFSMYFVNYVNSVIPTYATQWITWLDDLSGEIDSAVAAYHAAVPNTKLMYPEPFVATASAMHYDLWFLHILLYQYWLWFVFIFLIVFFFMMFLTVLRWCNPRIRPRLETRGVSRSKCADLITACVPVTWATSIIVNETTDALDVFDGFGTNEVVIGVRAYQWGWEYYYPRDLDVHFRMRNGGTAQVGSTSTGTFTQQGDSARALLWRAYLINDKIANLSDAGSGQPQWLGNGTQTPVNEACAFAQTRQLRKLLPIEQGQYGTASATPLNDLFTRYGFTYDLHRAHEVLLSTENEELRVSPVQVSALSGVDTLAGARVTPAMFATSTQLSAEQDYILSLAPRTAVTELHTPSRAYDIFSCLQNTITLSAVEGIYDYDFKQEQVLTLAERDIWDSFIGDAWIAEISELGADSIGEGGSAGTDQILRCAGQYLSVPVTTTLNICVNANSAVVGNFLNSIYERSGGEDFFGWRSLRVIADAAGGRAGISMMNQRTLEFTFLPLLFRAGGVTLGGVDGFVENTASLRAGARALVVNYNAAQKVFRARYDDLKSCASLDHLGRAELSLPLISGATPPVFGLLGRTASLYAQYCAGQWAEHASTSAEQVSSAFSQHAMFAFPLFLAQQSDATRYIWLDWYARWGFISIQPAAHSRYALYGMPHIVGNSEIPAATRDLFSDTETYFMRLARARRPYMATATPAPITHYRALTSGALVPSYGTLPSASLICEIAELLPSALLLNPELANFQTGVFLRTASRFNMSEHGEALNSLWASAGGVDSDIRYRSMGIASFSVGERSAGGADISIHNTTRCDNHIPLRKGIHNMIRLHATGAVAFPTEVRVQILASSKDVIHSWAVPSAGIKIDCVPGYSSHKIFLFLLSGIFWGQCMEICGRYHHWMPIVVYFMKRDLFFLWCYHFILRPQFGNAGLLDRNMAAGSNVTFDPRSWLDECR